MSVQTSLNMPGFSITLLLLPQANDSTSLPSSLLLSLLDEDCNAPGWKWSPKCPPSTETCPTSEAMFPPAKKRQTAQMVVSDPKLFVSAIEKACKALIAAEAEITRLDTMAGDGDCGMTLKVLSHLVDTRPRRLP
jgi:dihydroxyacetone kinase